MQSPALLYAYSLFHTEPLQLAGLFLKYTLCTRQAMLIKPHALALPGQYPPSNYDGRN